MSENEINDQVIQDLHDVERAVRIHHAAVRTWWPHQAIRNHDIADAAVLATLGAYHLGEPMPFPVKDRHTLALEAIAWP